MKRRPFRQGRHSAPRGRTSTIARLIERLTRETGRTPTDQQLAALLATSVAHIARARAALGAQGK
jgi:DNA-directed RNA polymerase specialized sigma subunit